MADLYQESPEPADPFAPEAETKVAPNAAEDLTVSEKANLARFLGEEPSKQEGQRIRRRFDTDVTSRSRRMKRCKELQEMYALVAKPKSFPWQNAANVKTPALTGPQLQIQSRLYDMVWPATGKVFNVLAGTVDELTIANMTEAFSNSYVRYKMPNMGQSLDFTTHQTTLYGSSFRRTYWNAGEHRIDSSSVGIDDFVVNHKYHSDDPSMSDVPRYTYIHRLCLDELQDLADEGTLVNVDKVKEHADDEDFADSGFRAAAAKIDGTDDVDDQEEPEYRKRPVLEQHYKMRLPNSPELHPAFDGKYHFVYALVDAWSSTLLRLCLREEDDPDDTKRFQRETDGRQQWQMAAQQRADALAAPPPPPQPQLDPMTGAPVVGMDGAPVMQPAPAPAIPPDPGPPPPEPKPIRKRQICFFTHYRCFPSDGFYGLGYGDILMGIAKAMDTTINQGIDGTTLKNAKPLFMSRQLRMQRGAVSVQPGSIVEIDGPIASLREGLMFLDPPPNDPNTVRLIEMLDGMKNAMVGSTDTMSGQIPKSNQAAAGIQMLIEQALTPITVLGRRIREAFAHELAKIWRCFGVFLADDELADIVQEGGQPGRVRISKAMFTPTARLVPTSDPRAKSQRIQDHQALFGYLTSNPLMQQNPQAAMAMFRALTEDGLRIFPDGERLMQHLPPPPQPPPPPPPMVPPFEEEAGWLNGQPAQVRPQDDDPMHIQSHQMFLGGQAGAMVAPDMRKQAEQHIRDHIAAIIRKQNGQQPGPAGPGGPPGPAEAPPPGGPQGGGPPPVAGPPPGPGPGGGAPGASQ